MPDSPLDSVIKGTAMRLPAPESVDVSSAPTIVTGTVVAEAEDGIDITQIPAGTPITVRKEELAVIIEGVQDALEDLEAIEKLCDPDEHRALLKLLEGALAALDEAQEMGVSIFETVLAGGNATFVAPPVDASQAPTDGVGSGT